MITQTEVIERLNALQSAGQYDVLLQEVNAYLADNPDVGILYLFKGDSLRELGDLQGALAAYRWAIMYDPNDVNARTNYAITLFELRDYVGALNAADAAILMEPDFADPYLISGNILSILGFPEQAMYPYHRAFEFHPEDVILGKHVAELYAKEDEPEEAFNVLMALLADHPGNRALHLQMATSLCFFMQNGVSLKQVDAFAQTWRDAFPKEDFVRQVTDALLAHQENFTPLTPDTVAAAFNDMAPLYEDANEDESLTFINLLENGLRQHFENKKDLKVLDIGCGSGMVAYPVTFYVTEGELLGVDVASQLLDLAAKKKLYNALAHKDAVSFAMEKRSAFDALIASDSLIYMNDLDKAFAAFNHALRKGGKFFFSIRHNTFSKDDQLLYPPYNWIFSEKYIRDMLDKNGFEVRFTQTMQEGLDETVHDKKFFYIAEKVK